MILKEMPLFPIGMKKGKKIGIFSWFGLVSMLSTDVIKLVSTLKGLLTGR